MRKINENDFVRFEICGDGWSYFIDSFKDAVREWNNVRHGTLYGIKPNGDKSIIDQE